MNFYDKIFLFVVIIISIGNLYNYIKYDEVKSIQTNQLSDDYKIWKNYLTKNL